jgi:hypothetical protein
MLVELFHWPPSDLAQADIDMILPLALYYPAWKTKARKEPSQAVYADQADWL